MNQAQEITNGVRAKIFALYIGCIVTRFKSHNNEEDGEIELTLENVCAVFNSKTTWYYKLQLTPLSDITDEHCIEVAKIMLPNVSFEDVIIERLVGVIKMSGLQEGWEVWWGGQVNHIDRIAIVYYKGVKQGVGSGTLLDMFDKLRELGYMLPAYGIPDLYAAGIAIKPIN